MESVEQHPVKVEGDEIVPAESLGSEPAMLGRVPAGVAGYEVDIDEHDRKAVYDREQDENASDAQATQDAAEVAEHGLSPAEGLAAPTGPVNGTTSIVAATEDAADQAERDER